MLNTDLDGAIAGAMLASTLQWTVVGWCDARGRPSDAVWLLEDVEILEDVIFVDVFVGREGVAAIDQHYIAGDEAVAHQLYGDGNKVNPNIADRERFRQGRNLYAQKFPFGTAHTVLAILENLRLDVPVDLNRPLDQNSNLRVGHLLMRCDDAQGNTIKYRANASDWWMWLEAIGGDLTGRLARWAQRDVEADSGLRFPREGYSNVVERLHKPISARFEQYGLGSTWNRYGRDGVWEDFSHADFSMAFDQGRLSTRAHDFLEELFSWFGNDGFTAGRSYRKYPAKHGGRMSWSGAAELLARPDTFSYAFVDMGDRGLSYTIFDPASLPPLS